MSAPAIAGLLAKGRRAANARMRDTFEMRQETGGTHYDPEAQAEVSDYEVLFTTRGRLRQRGAAGGVSLEVGGRVAVEVGGELSIPWDSPRVPDGVIAACIAVDASSDPTLLGARLRVEGPSPSSQTTARRLRVSEVLT